MKENPGKKPFKKSDDDFDFEILNALEGHGSSDDLQSGDENTIELSLDDDDLQFDEDAFDQSGEFSFDEGLSAGLEEELLKGGADLGLEDSFEEEMDDEEEMPSEDDSFSLDIGQGNAGEELSFDEEGMSLDLGQESFESESEEDAEFEAQDDELDAGFGETAESYGAETRVFTIPSEEKESFSFDKDMAIDDDSNISEEDNDGMELEEDDGLDSEEQEIDIDEEFADFEEDIEQGEDEFSDEEGDAFQAKSVISVGDDTVIDLGHEDDFEKEPVLPRASAPIPPAQPQPLVETMAEEMSEASADESETDEDSASGVFLDLQDEEEFDAMHIDLNEDAEGAPDTDLAAEMPEESEDMMETQEPYDESPEPTMQEELDVRAFLGLTLRLRDEQMQEFEQMIEEANTLQTYLEELGSHQPEIKNTIYQKLLVEYNARKRVIFQDEVFTDLLADVEQDLQDMLDQRQDFTATVTRLNEELEEITVRHLVGEYTDQILTEKKEDQTAEIALWNEKTEKIQAIIQRYQQAIDAERQLNPLRSETPTPEIAAPQEQPRAVVAPEPSLPEAPDTDMLTEESEDESLPESLLGEEEGEPSDESLDEELLGGLSDLTQQAFEEQETEEEDSDLFGGEDESDEFGSELPEDEDFEGGDFLVDDLSELEGLEEMEGEDENVSFDYDVESESEEEETATSAMIACKKCGRQTPADQKFCIHCGGKAQ